MKCTNPFVKKFATTKPTQDPITGIPTYTKILWLPCGKCMACRINRTREWTTRLLHEQCLSSSSYFITLTYDDEHLPRDDNDNPSVSKRDIQLFLKRLRKYDYESKIRFFISSEYGPQTQRPHYHGILFNVSDSILIPRDSSSPLFSRCEYGSISFINRKITDIWGNGSVTISPLVRERASYCAKYFINRKNVDDILTPNFSLMSRNPGIGSLYAKSIAYKVRYYHLNSCLTDKGTYTALPRLYKNKIYTEEERKLLTQNYVDNYSISVEQYRNYECRDIIENNQIKAMTFKNKKSKL